MNLEHVPSYFLLVATILSQFRIQIAVFVILLRGCWPMTVDEKEKNTW